MSDTGIPYTTLIAQAQVARASGDLEKAEQHLRDALENGSTELEALPLLHGVLMDRGRMPEALEAISRAVDLSPDTPGLVLALAQTLESLGQLSRGLDVARSCLQLDPTSVAARGVQASLLHQLGYTEKAVDILKALHAEVPDHTVVRGKLLLALHGDPRATLQEISDVARSAWSTVTPSATPGDFMPPQITDPKRKLKVAYVSGDFREHPVAYFLEGVLKAHDRERFEIHLVPTVPGSDKRTASMQADADGWRPIFAMNDDEAAAHLRALNYDIAVDLAGWTRGNRLGVFERRIAPVQITWMGYSGTTGLSNMDYILCDETVLPANHEVHYSETPLRLPGTYLNLVPPHTLLPELPPRPVPKAHRVIFGSFNSLSKMTEDVIDTWSEILTQADGSLLYLRIRQLVDDAVKADLAARFGKRGIASDRLVLEGNTTRKGLLASYRKVDIALDTFPYGGTTTTFEALAMGVPVITMRGDRWVGLVGASVLKVLDRDSWIAKDQRGYVETAVALATDIEQLVDVRETLGDEVIASLLCDTAAFTRHLEAAFEKVGRVT